MTTGHQTAPGLVATLRTATHPNPSLHFGVRLSEPTLHTSSRTQIAMMFIVRHEAYHDALWTAWLDSVNGLLPAAAVQEACCGRGRGRWLQRQRRQKSRQRPGKSAL